ncbi:hypothetical protein [Candidatus Borrarchaeum sp.]|uniref:hypothetical protein n=1 Tax=Candidatus Borrarchaeum sp. TaxID=2846742 RepID=UPI002580DD8B|nr:hypothetical protein [Candidatus Borrarchaeum sp.]
MDINVTKKSAALGRVFCAHEPFCEVVRSRDELLGLKEHELREIKEKLGEYKTVTKMLFEIINRTLLPYNAVLNIYSEKISKIKEVEAVYIFLRDNVIDIWTIIKEDDFDVKRKIAEVQGEIVDVFQEVLFDFLILSKEDIEADQSLLEDSIEIYQK